MKKSKTLYFLLAICLIITGLLSGCQSETKPVEQNQNSNDNLSVKSQNSTDKNKTLSICIESENPIIEFAVKRYQELNKDVVININNIQTTTVEGNTAINDLNKFNDIINTAFATGEIDDIIISPPNITALADKGLLVNLNDYIKFDEKDYFTNIINSYLYKGNLYTVPLSFTLDAVILNEDFQISGDNITLSTLLSLSDEFEGRDNIKLFDGGGSGFGNIDLSMLLYNLNSDKFIDFDKKTVDLNNKEFINILESVKKISDRNQILKSSDIESYDSFVSNTNKFVFSNIMAYSPTMCHNGTIDYTGLNIIVNDKGQAVLGSSHLQPVISSNCNNKELAADFIKFLLSDEIQSSSEMYFCPVNKKAMEENAYLYYESTKNEDYFPEDFDETNVKNNIEIYKNLIEKVTILNKEDPEINTFIFEELKLFFSDTQNATETAQNLENKIQLYLMNKSI